MSKVDMFLALNGSRQGAIQGESVGAGHEGQCEILGWSWGMAQQVHSLSQQHSKASVRTVTVRKHIDSASTAIMSALRSAESLNSVVITCRDPAGEADIDYLRITLKKARITDYELQAAADDERQVSESFSIAFKEIEVVYTPKSGANAKSGACTYIDHYE